MFTAGYSRKMLPAMENAISSRKIRFKREK
jgi:hypothetical protein